MVERICPNCQHGNPLENRFCGACGGSLERDALAVRPTSALARMTQHLPLARIQQVGGAVALGLAAVAVEAGAAWLTRRQQGLSALAPTTAKPQSTKPGITITSQRILEVWEAGQLRQKIVEQHHWRREED